jgi:divalent metal cation (Fe/Co/Zn/Cd) transporter
LIGEGADHLIVNSVMRAANEMDGVDHANGILTVHLAPDQILVALSLEFADDLRTPDIEAKIVELERRVRTSFPSVIAVFVKPQSAGGFSAARQRRYGHAPKLLENDLR